MSEEFVVRHTSPTLAGLKTGNLFNCTFQNKQKLYQELRELNRKLVPKGARIIPMKIFKDKVLLYLYRPRLLEQDFHMEAVANLLKEYGYTANAPEKCVVQLIQKMCASETFPHEIGLFLSYPPEDVCGFINHPEKGCKCVGCWKVYGDEEAARKRFAEYKKCETDYYVQMQKGKGIEDLILEM